MTVTLHFLNEDTRLLDRIRRGDEDALVTLYRQSCKSVMALVTRNSGTAGDAEEVLQEALVILWERVRQGRYRHAARLETFLYATARNLWLRRLARVRREAPREIDPEELASEDPSPLDQLIESEESALIANALRRLGEPCRTLLVLFYWEEANMEEIAGRLGFANAETAKSKKYQCKKALQEMLKRIAHYG
jgi:RNA polymerase sigma factor (sigma-70 family)